MKNKGTNLFLSLLLILSIIFAFNKASSQTFSISQIDASKFPLIQASFVALDANGKSYDNLTVGDFIVVEDGKYMAPPNLRLTCRTEEVDPEVNVVLVLDQSTSMNTKDTIFHQTRWSWVVDGAKAFINTLKFVKRTQVAILSFGGEYYLRCPFTNDKKRLFDSIDATYVGGLTKYDPPLIDSSYGPDGKTGSINMLSKMPADMRRIVIFLTDGQPSVKPSYDSIVNRCNDANVQLYAITLTMPMLNDLRDACRRVGGAAYEVFTRDDLTNIYKFIAIDIQTKNFCDLFWTTEYGCDEYSRTRNCQITFRKTYTVERTYTAPPNSIAKYIFTNPEGFGNPTVSGGSPPVSSPISKTITISPTSSTFNMTGMHIQPPTYFTITDGPWLNDKLMTYPFVFDTTDTMKIGLQFIQRGSQSYRQASLILEGNPCPPVITLIGGTTQVLITNPFGGEFFRTCDVIDITWAGVDANVPVDLYYSEDGINWILIKTNVTGHSYKWTPPKEGVYFKIKATVNEQFRYLFGVSYGGTKADGGESIDMCQDNLYMYVCGFFTEKANFGDKIVVSTGGTDTFLGKFDNQGNLIWIEKGGGPDGQDTAHGVTVDRKCNPFVTGVCYKGASFGGITPNMQFPGTAYCFVARYSETGGTPLVKLIGATGVYTKFQAIGERIKVDSIGQIFIQGKYTGQIDLGGGLALPRIDVWKPFSAMYDVDFTLKTLKTGMPLDIDTYSADTVTDGDGALFKAGTYSGTYNVGDGVSLKSAGDKDVFITKHGKIPGSNDTTDVFSVDKPVLTFTVTSPIVMDNVTLGGSNSQVFSGLLKNTSKKPILIMSNFITAKDGSIQRDFAIVTPLDGRIIQPDESIEIEIAFTPQLIGLREAKFTINGECAAPISIIVSGTGVCSAKVVALINMGDKTLNLTQDSIVFCIFKNTNSTAIKISPKLECENPTDFELWYPDGSSKVADIWAFPDTCITLMVRFTPTGAGLRKACIKWHLPDGCEQPQTLLEGNGVDANITVSSIDWGERRVRSVNDSFIVVSNKTILPVNVTEIRPRDAVGQEFDIDLTKVGIIPANSTVQIPVKFKPQDEITYDNAVQVKVSAIPTGYLNAPIHGIGILPKIELKWICNTPVKPGETSTAYLRVKNPSLSAQLKVQSIDFEVPTGDFVWPTGAPANLTIGKNDSMDIPVTFSPQGTGTRRVNVVVLSDAYDGTETGPKKTVIEASCDALGIGVENPVDFGKLLLCDASNPRLVELSNKGGSTPITIVNHYFEGGDSTAFIVIIPGNFVVEPNSTQSFLTVFTPTEEKEYRSTLVLVNSINEQLKTEFIGEGHIIHFSTPQSKIQKEPGYKEKVHVYGEVADLAKPTIDKIVMQMKFNNKMAEYVPNSIQNTVPSGWNWTATLISDGVLEISGSGTAMNTPFRKELFSLDFEIYLCDVPSSELYFQPVLGVCKPDDTLGAKITLEKVCFLTGRLVKIGSGSYYLNQPVPNPATSQAKVEFGIGIEANTSIELINSMGSKIGNFVNSNLKPGDYDLTIPLDEIPSGVYMLIIHSGPYVDKQKLVITK